MDSRIFLFIVIGAGLMAAVGVERWIKTLPFSLPMPLIYIAAGFAVFWLPTGLPPIDVLGNEAHSVATEYLTEFIVIASLLGAGIAIDRPFSFHGWAQVMRLIILAMPATIAVVALLGWGWLGLAPASALLLAAVLAPTDPVLAKSVAVGPPGDDERDDVRFDLTVESGLNDGLAFPFTYLAVAAVGMTSVGGWTLEWFGMDFVWRIFAGTVVGIGAGWLMARYVFKQLREGERADEKLGEPVSSEEAHSFSGLTSEGLVVLGSLLLAYGLAEAIEGYGFISVFVGAVAAKQYNRDSKYHQLSHHFIDQIEEIVLVIMLIGFGGLLASGILDALSWQGALLGLLLLFVIRPVIGYMSSFGCHLPWQGKLAVAFFGVRGMGSVYYLAYAQNKTEFSMLPELWAITCFTILASIVVHGFTAELIMDYLKRTGQNVVPGMPESEFKDPGLPHDEVVEDAAQTGGVVGEGGPAPQPAPQPTP